MSIKRFHGRREEKKRIIGRKRRGKTVCTNCHHWKPDVDATGLCAECRPIEEDTTCVESDNSSVDSPDTIP